MQRLDDEFGLGVFQAGRIVFVQDFADFDHNGDGVINDNDLLFAVTIRSAVPDRPLILPNSDNNFVAGYFQDDWHVHPHLLNLGLRYELDTDLNNVGHFNQLNPILLPFVHGKRHKDTNNFGPRVGFNWATPAGRFSVHGGYGIYYDRITLECSRLNEVWMAEHFRSMCAWEVSTTLITRGTLFPGLPPLQTHSRDSSFPGRVPLRV